MPMFFDASRMTVEQLEAKSRDGTSVPYFVVGTRGVKNAPTMLYGYGGFENAIEPFYSGALGRAWLSRGGVLVVANIRGGGEFGPAWHQAALKEKRQNAFDDFIAIAEDLARRGIAQPKQIGIRGGSNGGLLVGAALTQRPELFGAAVAQVPLLDMKRYSKLLAGASWMAEYGDPDVPEQWAYIASTRRTRTWPSKRSIRRRVRYIPRDDRVHPAPCAKNVRADARTGARRLVLRKHGGRARRSVEQRTARVDGRDRIHVFVEAPRRYAVIAPSMQAIEISQPGDLKCCGDRTSLSAPGIR